MEAGALLMAIGGFLLAGVGYLVFLVVADIATDEAKEAVFRRASFAVRRSRHRALMKTGYVFAVLAFLAAFFWLAAATSGREADAGDARMFGMLAAGLALAASGLLATWWRRAGLPQTYMDISAT
jgi:apolipoprotein N-acyltransferase